LNYDIFLYRSSQAWFIIQQVIRREATLELPFFDDASQAPVPPDSVRIESLEVQPYRDLRRLNIQIRITPFQISPSIELVINNPELEEVATTSIIGAGSPRLALVMHLRQQEPRGTYTLNASVHYDEQGKVDQKQLEFTLAEEDQQASES
jgi:hypothetical protein